MIKTITKLAKHPVLELVFSFEDDGRTGYGYLHDPNRVVADVWLYNRGITPDRPDWDISGRVPMPYRNSVEYVRPQKIFDLPASESDIEIFWASDGVGNEGVEILLRGYKIAELFVGDMPGRSLMALKDGPVAKVLV